MPYSLALLASTIFGVAFNYLSFGRLVFNQGTGWFAFGRFVAAYVFIYFVNSILLSQLINHLLVSPYMGQIICIPISIAISWVAMNYWVYRK
jgi:putative flippase GtrA